MTVSVHEHMHHDHRAWRAEVDQWCDDIELWEKEVRQAESRLRDLEQALRAHSEALSVHATAIRNRKQTSDKHEAAIAAWESGDTGAELPAMAVAHEQESKTQEAHRNAHERIRHHHHSVIANWSLLMKAVDHAM